MGSAYGELDPGGFGFDSQYIFRTNWYCHVNSLARCLLAWIGLSTRCLIKDAVKILWVRSFSYITSLNNALNSST